MRPTPTLLDRKQEQIEAKKRFLHQQVANEITDKIMVYNSKLNATDVKNVILNLLEK